jgi:hypothetical protein
VNRKKKWFKMEIQGMRLETNRHMDEEAIERYSLGNISEEEASQFEEHLLICESCQNRVTESDDYVSTMQCASAEIRAQAFRTEKRWWFFPRLVPTLAAAVSIVLLTFVGLYWTAGPANWHRTQVANQPAVIVNLVATRGSGIEAKAPAGRALTLQLDLSGLPPDPSFRLEMVDGVGRQVWRGPPAIPKPPLPSPRCPAVSILSAPMRPPANCFGNTVSKSRVAEARYVAALPSRSLPTRRGISSWE